jgi:hypothetical protein
MSRIPVNMLDRLLSRLFSATRWLGG